MTKKTAGRGFGARVARKEASPNILDRLAGWLGKLPRSIRILISAIIAIILTGSGAMLAYGYLFSQSTDKLSTNLIWIMLAVFAVIGSALYWVGWRMLVGFEIPDPDDPVAFRPGRAGALLVIVAVAVLFAVILVVVFNTIQAVGPA